MESPLICEGVSGTWFFHLRAAADVYKSLCGAAVMSSGLSFDRWNCRCGNEAIQYRWCKRCWAIYRLSTPEGAMERTIISDRVRSVLLRVSDYDQELGELLMLGQALVAHPHLDLRIVRDQIAVECNVSPDALRLQRQTTIRELIDQIVSLAAKND